MGRGQLPESGRGIVLIVENAADDFLNSGESPGSILPEINIEDLAVMSDLDSDEEEHYPIDQD